MTNLTSLEVNFAGCQPMPKGKTFTFDGWFRGTTQQARPMKDRITGEDIPDHTVQLLYLRDKESGVIYVTRSVGLVRQFDQVAEDVANLESFTVSVQEQKIGTDGATTWRFVRTENPPKK